MNASANNLKKVGKKWNMKILYCMSEVIVL